MKRKGDYYIRFLSDSELHKFIFEVNRSCGNGYLNYLDYLNKDFRDFYEFIGGGFIWSNSADGHHYWANISHRKIDGFNFKRFDKFTMI